MVIAVDYDGTITKRNAYPEVGEVKENCVDVLNKLKAMGHKIILWTCRCDEGLAKALDYMKGLGLEFDKVNAPIYEWEAVNPSRKICADIYLDDMAFPFVAARPDIWNIIGEQFNLPGYGKN